MTELGRVLIIWCGGIERCVPVAEAIARGVRQTGAASTIASAMTAVASERLACGQPFRFAEFNDLGAHDAVIFVLEGSECHQQRMNEFLIRAQARIGPVAPGKVASILNVAGNHADFGLPPRSLVDTVAALGFKLTRFPFRITSPGDISKQSTSGLAALVEGHMLGEYIAQQLVSAGQLPR